MKHTFAVAVLLFTAVCAQAQGFKVESVAMKLMDPIDRTSPEWFAMLDECVNDIVLAAEHPKTAADPKMYFYYGVTFLSVYREGSDEQKAKYPDALSRASKAFFKSIELDEKSKYTSKSEAQLLDCAIGHFNLGVNYYNDKKYDKALESYAGALKIIPLDKEGELKRRNITPETIYQYSYYAARANNDNTTAKQYINKLIDQNFNDPRVYVDMASILLAEKDTAAALTYITKGKEIAPDNMDLINTELDIYLKQGKSGDLIGKLSDAIAADPGNKVYYFARAISYEKLGETDKAENDYRKAIELDENYADAHYNLGVIFINRCKPIADEIDKTYDDKKLLELEKKIDVLYIQAAEQFELALDAGEYEEQAQTELKGTLKRIYARLMQNNDGYKKKYNEIKADLGE